MVLFLSLFTYLSGEAEDLLTAKAASADKQVAL